MLFFVVIVVVVVEGGIYVFYICNFSLEVGEGNEKIK
jgi:hypothetical protein